jgi:hypothetical protein
MTPKDLPITKFFLQNQSPSKHAASFEFYEQVNSILLKYPQYMAEIAPHGAFTLQNHLKASNFESLDNDTEMTFEDKILT